MNNKQDEEQIKRALEKAFTVLQNVSTYKAVSHEILVETMRQVERAQNLFPQPPEIKLSLRKVSDEGSTVVTPSNIFYYEASVEKVLNACQDAAVLSGRWVRVD